MFFYAHFPYFSIVFKMVAWLEEEEDSNVHNFENPIVTWPITL